MCETASMLESCRLRYTHRLLAPRPSRSKPLPRFMTQLAPDTLAQALDGDPSAVRALVRHFTPVIQCRVARTLFRRAPSGRSGSVRQEVEDLTQEVFASLFAKNGHVLRCWDPERGLSLLNFVGLVAEREVTSILRSGRRNPWTEDPMDAPKLQTKTVTQSPERAVESREMFKIMLDKLRTELSPLGFRIFELLWCEEKSTDAVCEELNMSPDAVYAWRSRIRKLAKKLAQEMSASPPARASAS